MPLAARSVLRALRQQRVERRVGIDRHAGGQGHVGRRDAVDDHAPHGLRELAHVVQRGARGREHVPAIVVREGVSLNIPDARREPRVAELPAVTAGITMGTTRMMAAAECRNIPITRKKTFRMRRIAHFSAVIDSIAAAAKMMRFSPL